MSETNLNRFVAFLFLMGTVGACAQAQRQETDISKFEVGAQFSSLALTPPALKKEVGIGGRITYNFTDHVAIDAEGNYFPSGSTRDFEPGGNVLQGQLGLKVGKRWDRFGIFAKARPGFVSFDGTFAARRAGTKVTFGNVINLYDFDIIRTTHPSMDLGGVVEVYPSRRVIVRFDAGDTIIRHRAHDELDFSRTPGQEFFHAPARTSHNFQFTAGVSFRLMKPAGDSPAGVQRSTTDANNSTPRFEVGAHLTSLTFNPPRQLFGFPTISGENRPLTETGFGGRFTVNLIDSIALESEVNYFPASNGVATGASGRVSQGQFGVKAGKRFSRFGFFAKARPGFVSFNRSLKLAGFEPINFGGEIFKIAIFKPGRRTFFANDFGGVIEFYPTRRWSLRFDAGDTIIHYSDRSVSTGSVRVSFITAPPEKRHNFQFSSGFAYRF
jgi:hypothetical protein